MSNLETQNQKNQKLTDDELMLKVLRLEQKMLDMKDAQVKLVETNHFSDGLYARELFIPKGTLLTGKIHKKENLNILSKGEISVSTENGVKRLKAPQVIVSPPGTKRVGFAHEDTIWITIHATEETDLEKIEKEFIAETFEDVQLTGNEKDKLKGDVCRG